jgi:hypothetical protein
MKRFAVSVALALASAVTALSPAAAAHHRPHYVFARLGAGVCDVGGHNIYRSNINTMVNQNTHLLIVL